MNRRKFLRLSSEDPSCASKAALNIPPLFKADHSVFIGVNFCEELVKLRAWYYETSSSEGCPKFVLVQLAILISINALEEFQKLALRLLDKSTELCAVLKISLLTGREDANAVPVY